MTELITVVDNAGREKQEHVAYIVTDIRGELVYVTIEGLQYANDSLSKKPRQLFLLEE